MRTGSFPLGLLLLFFANVSMAGTQLKPFEVESLQQITEKRNGQPFMLVLWSVDCPPCFKELAQLQKLNQQFSSQNLVLIATDDIRDIDTVRKTLNDFQLGNMDNWIFTGTMPERLRFAVDPGWYGELPRAYFYDRSHQRRAHSGSLNKNALEAWLKNSDTDLEVGALR